MLTLLGGFALTLAVFLAVLVIAPIVLGVRYIPHRSVGIVERLWSRQGSVSQGRILALEDEAGFQPELLRGGLHVGYFFWQYRIHIHPLVTVSEGQIAYCYARDGEPLEHTSSLGRTVESNDFQDARAFLMNHGQRGRQRAILREGVYAINLVQFVVLTAEHVYAGPISASEASDHVRYQQELLAIKGFDPVIISQGQGDGRDTIGVVTVHDGPNLESSEVIASDVNPPGRPGHACFQEPERFLQLGGRRGRQLQVVTDGTWFINRWFATVELHPKTVIPIGYVGVVVSYHGVQGEDVTGDLFRYGEQVEAGHRGVWKRALPPGKYALNPYAIKVELVPTVNFVLRWVTGLVEAHQYDKDLSSIALITADGYEPMLPLSLVLHIDYEKAPRVVQRFGDVRRLISQTLDPILSAYFRDVAQSSNMLDLLTRREEIQARATDELGRRFREYDINCIAVMIGRPEPRTQNANEPIETLFDQLRQRRLAEEQMATWRQQEEAAAQLRTLRRAEAEAQKQTELSQAEMNVAISIHRANGALEETRRRAESAVLEAKGDAEARTIRAHADAEAIARTGEAEAGVARQKVEALGDPRLHALSEVVAQLSQSTQPLVPQQMVALGEGTSPLAALMGALMRTSNPQ